MTSDGLHEPPRVTVRGLLAPRYEPLGDRRGTGQACAYRSHPVRPRSPARLTQSKPHRPQFLNLASGLASGFSYLPGCRGALQQARGTRRLPIQGETPRAARSRDGWTGLRNLERWCSWYWRHDRAGVRNPALGDTGSRSRLAREARLTSLSSLLGRRQPTRWNRAGRGGHVRVWTL